MGLWLYDPSEIQQTFRQQCCRVVRQISQQYGDPNSQSRGLNTSSPRTHRPFWIRNLTIPVCWAMYASVHREESICHMVIIYIHIVPCTHTAMARFVEILLHRRHDRFTLRRDSGKAISVDNTRAPSQYPKRRLFVRSRKVSKPRDWYFKLSYRFEIWLAHRQHCCRSACQVSERSDNSKYKSRGFETLRDLTERRLLGYWDGALLVCIWVCATRHTLIFTHTNRRYHMRCGPDPMAWLGHMQSISHQA